VDTGRIEREFRYPGRAYTVGLDPLIDQAKSSVDLSKSTLSKMSLPLKAILARQEFGSMLPVLALTRGGWMKPGS
jgi:hypothetical protein